MSCKESKLNTKQQPKPEAHNAFLKSPTTHIISRIWYHCNVGYSVSKWWNAIHTFAASWCTLLMLLMLLSPDDLRDCCATKRLKKAHRSRASVTRVGVVLYIHMRVIVLDTSGQIFIFKSHRQTFPSILLAFLLTSLWQRYVVRNLYSTESVCIGDLLTFGK